jgi:hypothetical protein
MIVGYTKPQPAFCRDEKISRGKGNQLFAAGEVDTVMVVGRRHVIWQSWLDYLERQRRGIPRDPAEKARAAAEYRRTADETLRRQGRSLIRGSAPGRPNRKKQAAPEPAEPAKSVSPATDAGRKNKRSRAPGGAPAITQ